MNLLEKIKKEKGIVNIDTFRYVLGEIIDDSIENSMFSVSDKKDNIVLLIENMIVLTFRDEKLEDVDVEGVKSLSSACCGTLSFSREFEEKSYRDVLIKCIWNSLGMTSMFITDDDTDLIESSKTLSKVLEIMDYIESGNIPYSEYENIPLKDLEKSIEEIIYYFYKKDFED